MCTAATYKTADFYFGRTLDAEFSYFEEITVAPRNYIFNFKNIGAMQKHYSIIGMAYIVDNYPLYYDAVNEKGLAMAGLNFIGNAVYNPPLPSKDNVAQFELIPWILGQCDCVKSAKSLLERLNIVGTSFNEQLPVAKLHWIIADKDCSITVEAVEQGLKIYENPIGILTNNPPFDMQLQRLNDYMHLSSKEPSNNFSNNIDLKAYSRGMGAIGLPGDLSSSSRFIRAAFVKLNSVCCDSEKESVSQFFHILGAVNQTRGCCRLDNDKLEKTIYTSCCNADKGIYYYTTYNNHQITAVDIRNENPEGSSLIHYPIIKDEQIKIQNQ